MAAADAMSIMVDMKRVLGISCLLFAGLVAAESPPAGESPPVATGGLSPARGYEHLTKKAYVPASWTKAAYQSAWKRWPGVKEKPDDYDRAFAEYYGLHPAPFNNGNLPMGMKETKPLLN